MNGVFITFGAAFLLPVMGELGFANTTFGDADFQWYGILVGNVANLGAPVLYIGLGVSWSGCWRWALGSRRASCRSRGTTWTLPERRHPSLHPFRRPSEPF